MDTLLEKYVINGGPMMFVLIPCSLLMLGAVLQGLIRLRRRRVLPPGILKKAGQLNDDATRCQFILDLHRFEIPLARSIWLALKDFDPGGPPPERQSLEAAIGEASTQAANEMRDGLGLLETIYTIAPLLGLMGTILGMMNTFYDFAVAQEKSVQLLSIGIQEALVTTLWGLGIAIPAFVATQWLDSIITAYERRRLPAAATRVIQHLFAADAVATPSDAEAGEPSGTFEETGDPPPNPGPQPPDSGHRADSEPQR